MVSQGLFLGERSSHQGITNPVAVYSDMVSEKVDPLQHTSSMLILGKPETECTTRQQYNVYRIRHNRRQGLAVSGTKSLDTHEGV